MLDRISALMDSLRQVSNDVAHDLRTPLTRLRQRLEASLRLGGAKEQRVAAYVVFADKTLIDMARRKPATVAEMGAVHGVGAAKLRQYGEVFLDVIRQHAAGRP